MKRLAAIGALALLGGALVVLAGLVPLHASSGHWAITHWFLDFTKQRSVSTWSAGVEVPPLDDPTLVPKGAGLYETGCRPCHGAPGQAHQPEIPARMTPRPPDLKTHVWRWTDAELFTIVRHGIKFTGMPAWPADSRDDEVWAVVAFARRLPGIDGAAYARLVGMPPPAPTADPIDALARDRCARCHGLAGEGRVGAAFPRLAGQRPEYLRLALEAYASGARHSGAMAPLMADLDAPAMRALAERYAAMPTPPPTAVASEAAMRGAEIAARGIPSQQVPRCSECHGPAATRRHAAYPRHAGQFAGYLRLQLDLFAEGRRGGSPYAHLMADVAWRLTPAQRDDVAAYYASLAPDPPGEP
jgi:cytochrome c553